MNYLLDTCALIHLFKGSSLSDKIITHINKETEPFLLISIVTKAELFSIATQNNWGEKKREKLNQLLSKFILIPINTEDIIVRYSEIDSFSQGRLATRSLPSGITSRNMGKNDIWIAATASLTKSQLLTSDDDFDHLNKEFIDLVKIV